MMKKVEIIPLGTVSPYCKDKMNCPGFLVKIGNEKILLDAGNGITREMNFPSDLNNLYILISHYHKDHYGDLGSIQYASYVYNKLHLLEKPIHIYMPKEDVDNSKLEIISNKQTYSKYHDIDESSRLKISDIEVTFKDNKSHTVNSYMIKLENKEIKIVYTSDVGTSNIQGIVEFSREADLLICESSLLGQSTLDTHLTAVDAAKIAKEAKVKKLMLTHFWPEIEKDKYLKEAKEIFKNTIIAEENKSIIYNIKEKEEEER